MRTLLFALSFRQKNRIRPIGDEKDIEIAALRKEVKELKKKLLEATTKGSHEKQDQQLAPAILRFQSVGNTPAVKEAVSDLTQSLEEGAEKKEAPALERKTREVLQTTIEAKVNAQNTVAECYGVIDAYTQHFAPIYQSVWNLVTSAEDCTQYRSAVDTLRKITPIQAHGACLQQNCPDNLLLLYREAHKTKLLFDKALQLIFDETVQATLQIPAKLKNPGRALEKALLRRDNKTVACVLDVVRAMIIAESMDQISVLIFRLVKSHSFKILRYKDRFLTTPAAGGWRDCLINVSLTDSKHICEIQFVHKTMLTARANLPGHQLYAQCRNASEILEYSGLDAAQTNKQGLAWTFANTPVAAKANTKRPSSFSFSKEDLTAASSRRKK